MKIRDLTMEDYEAADGLMQDLHSMHVSARPDIYAPAEHLYSREDFQEILACGQCISLAAEDEGELVGLCFAAIRENSTPGGAATAYMEDLCVREDSRRKGVAAALFQEAEKRAKEQKAVRLELTAWAFNHQAIAFYEAMGMKPQRYVLEKDLTQP